MTTTNQNYRSNGYHYRQFSLAAIAQAQTWEGIVDTDAAAFAKMDRMTSGSEIFDTSSGTALVTYFNEGLTQRLWRGQNCTVLPFVAGAALTKYRFGQFDTAAPGEVIVPAGAGQTHGGIIMNSALEGELVYLLECGAYFVELSNPLVAIDTGARVATDVAGKVLAAAAGDFYAGYCDIPSITINGVACARVQFRLPVAIPAL